MNKSADQEKYWDNVAEEKEFTTFFQMELFEKYVPKEARILDVGCGYGRTLNELSLAGFTNLSGVDISEKMVARGLALYPDIVLRKNQSGGIPFEDNAFDAVIILAVLTCIIDNAEQEKFINEIKRVLRTGGVVYINDFLLNHDQRNVDRYRQYEAQYNRYGIFELPEGVTFRHHTWERIDELTSGFDKIAFQQTVYTTMNGNRSNGFYYLGYNRS